MGKAAIVPAVLPCGACEACRARRGSICPQQVFPGNDIHGGFASHVRVPARGLCAVPDLRRRESTPAGVDLAALSVIADAVSTPYQAILRSGLSPGDLAVFVGVGGVGGFGVQIAAARGATSFSAKSRTDSRSIATVSPCSKRRKEKSIGSPLGYFTFT